MSKIYLIRHGESEMNAMQNSLKPQEKVILGRCNWSPLSQKGVEEARNVGRYLNRQGIVFDHIACSPAVRTQQTASHALEQLLDHDTLYRVLNSIQLSESLLERCWGAWDFQLKNERHIVDYQNLLEHNPSVFWDYLPPSGESNADVAERVRSFIEEYMLSYENSAVFTHRGCICALLVDAFRLNPKDILNLWMGPGSVSILTYEHNQWQNYKAEVFTPNNA